MHIYLSRGNKFSLNRPNTCRENQCLTYARFCSSPFTLAPPVKVLLVCRLPKGATKGGNCKAAYKGRLWCYVEDINGSVYCKDAVQSRK